LPYTERRRGSGCSIPKLHCCGEGGEEKQALHELLVGGGDPGRRGRGKKGRKGGLLLVYYSVDILKERVCGLSREAASRISAFKNVGNI